MIERAMMYYKLLKHKEGFIKCAAQCKKQENPPNKVVKLNVLHDPNYLPFVERDHRHEFFSLGIEPVFTTKFEHDIDIDSIPAIKRRSTGLMHKVTGLKKMHVMKTDNFIDEHNLDDIKVSKGMPTPSKTLREKVGKFKGVLSHVIAKKAGTDQLLKKPSIDARLSTNPSAGYSKQDSSTSKKSSSKAEHNFKSPVEKSSRNQKTDLAPEWNTNFDKETRNSKNKEILERKKVVNQMYTFHKPKNYNSRKHSPHEGEWEVIFNDWSIEHKKVSSKNINFTQDKSQKIRPKLKVIKAEK